MSDCEPMPKDEEEDLEEAVWEDKLTLDNLAKGLQWFNSSFDIFYDMNPSMIWTVKQKQMVEKWMMLYGNSFREIEKQIGQTEDNVFL